MSNSNATQWNSFVEKLLNPSLVDQLGSDIEAAKLFINGWAQANFVPLINSAQADAAALRASATTTAAEAATLRERMQATSSNNPVADNLRKVIDEVAKTKEANAARLNQLAEHADVRALSNAERAALALDTAKQLGAMAGLLDVAMKAGGAFDSGKWDEVGETSVGVLTGLGAGAAAALLFASTPTLVALAAGIALGYAGAKAGEAFIWPLLKQASQMIPNEFWDGLFSTAERFPTEMISIISRFLGINPDPLVKAIRYVWVDPLVLDLDGDGLEITPLSRGVQFDTNGDTVKTATAWVGADDGLLVLDRNGNGVIDSGRELFGDETLLADGKKAAHGFAALAELDVGGTNGGAGDGLFDAKDAQYTNVRIWRDLNQDGISQANELQTMAEAGIASVKLSSTKTDTSYGDAQLVQSGSFTRADGSEGQAGSFILAQNNAVTTHPPITISAAAQALPGVQGSGWVRGLQEAATLKPQLVECYRQRVRRGHAGEQRHRVCGPGAGRGHQAGDVSVHPLRHRESQRGQGDAGRGE